MKHRFCSLVGIALLVPFAGAPKVRADLFVPGSTFQFTYEDPSSGNQFTNNVTFNPNGAATLLDNGALSLSEQTLVVNPKTEWVQFYLKTTSGGPLTFYSEYFYTYMNNLQLSQPAGVSNFIFAFTKNGQTSGDPFFDPLIPAPINPPISGNVADVVSNPSTLYTSIAEYLYATPVGAYLSAWGVDSSVNGFVMGMEVQAPNSTVPEPSSLALCVTGVFSLTAGSWWRRRRAA